MTSKTLADCTWCIYREDLDVHLLEINRDDDEPCSCNPVIDAEKSNKALRMVAQIRERTGREQ